MCFDGDPPAVFSESVQVSRRDRRCVECPDGIRKGEAYQRISGLWDGAWSHFATCARCVWDRERVSRLSECREAPPITGLRDALHDYDLKPSPITYRDERGDSAREAA